MKKYRVEFEVPDDFQKGCCDECPLYSYHWEDYDDDGYIESDMVEHFPKFCYERCPLEEVKV